MTEKGLTPDATVTTKDIAYAGAAGQQKARVYTPAGAGANTTAAVG